MIEKSLHAERQGKNNGFKIDPFIQLCLLDSRASYLYFMSSLHLNHYTMVSSLLAILHIHNLTNILFPLNLEMEGRWGKGGNAFHFNFKQTCAEKQLVKRKGAKPHPNT